MIGKAAILMFSSLFVLIKENQVNGLKCYVCDDEGTNPCYNFEFDKNKFIQECSALEKGCFTESHVNKKYRSCASQTLNDCKVANGVEYCFCSTELCNDNEACQNMVVSSANNVN
ncbi:hypothetical protein JTB14_002804 [Gonioctena quinquepunctata]|nr:hypothetical protein JTB14_002804 [Gonioctena quinquepunctata]